MSKTEDLKWVSRATLLGDTTAFDNLVRKYQSSIRRFFLNLTMGDTQLSDDLAQETFIKAWLNLSSFQGLAGFSTWLFRIAYNVYYDSVRSRKFTSEIDETEVNRCTRLKTNFQARSSTFIKHCNYFERRNERRFFCFTWKIRTTRRSQKLWIVRWELSKPIS